MAVELPRLCNDTVTWQSKAWLRPIWSEMLLAQ
jgi:hypothetical protein